MYAREKWTSDVPGTSDVHFSARTACGREPGDVDAEVDSCALRRGPHDTRRIEGMRDTWYRLSRRFADHSARSSLWWWRTGTRTPAGERGIRSCGRICRRIVAR